MKQEELKLTTQLLTSDWNLSLSSTDINDQILLGLLSQRIKWLLENDLAGLMNTFYRMDIPESIFMASSEDVDPSMFLAEAVLKRTKQKVATRLRYREMNDYEN